MNTSPTSTRTLIGFRIRDKRKALGMSQATLATRLGISASYLNLIESNKRSIGGRLLKQIADELGVALDQFDGAAERRLVGDLRELTSENLFAPLGLDPAAAADFAGQHPQWAQALVTLHRAYLDRSETVSALSDRLNQDPFLGEAVHNMLSNVAAIRSASEILDNIDELRPEQTKRFLAIVSAESARLADVAQALAAFFDKAHTSTRSITPIEEVDDFLLEHETWFPQLEQAAEVLRAAAGIAGERVEGALCGYLEQQHGIRVSLRSAFERESGNAAQRALYDEESRTFTMLETMPQPTRRFELARKAAELSCAELIAAQVNRAALLSTPAAMRRATRALSSYVASAVLLPYDAFQQAAAAARYDIDYLCQKFGASFEQVCHRLVTLRKPGADGIRFGFMRSDPAGYVTKRFPLPHLPLPRYGNACPLWAIYKAFQAPGATVRQIAEFPTGDRYFFLARAVEKPVPSFSAPRHYISVMLICDAIHADRTVYGDGIDRASAAQATPVGPTCRQCVRRDCAHREEDPIINA
jgi:predicted transcriptional regulator/transcriptional regulator with XRE-family HTH domain